MSDEAIADLKQFITATVSQQISSVKTELKREMHEFRIELESEIKQSEQRLEKKLGDKIDALAASVADALEASNDSHEGRLDDHNRRLTLLERRTA